MSKTSKKIAKIIPFVTDNFITMPLQEEGVFGPMVNMWRIFDTIQGLEQFTDINFQTDTIKVAYDVSEVPNISAGIENKEIKFRYENTVHYYIDITIYHKDDQKLALEDLLDVAVNIAQFKVSK